MDMMGKAMFSHQVGKFKEDLGFKGDEEEKERSSYDPQKEAEEEAKAAEQRAKRKEEQGKKQAERAANRNKIREKYGLKESKHDQHLEAHGGKPSTDTRKSSGDHSTSLTRSTTPTSTKKDDKCAVM